MLSLAYIEYNFVYVQNDSKSLNLAQPFHVFEKFPLRDLDKKNLLGAVKRIAKRRPGAS